MQSRLYKRNPEKKASNIKHEAQYNYPNKRKKAHYIISIKQADSTRAFKKKKIGEGEGLKQLKPFHIHLHRI